MSNNDVCDGNCVSACADCITGMIESGQLRVEVDEGRPAGYFNTAYVGERSALRDMPARLVHVINPAVGGEIRGYLLIAGKLHLRLPSYTGLWPAMDAAIAKRCDGAFVVPYAIDAGGMEKQP